MSSVSKAIWAGIAAFSMAWGSIYTPWIGTNSYGRFLGFPEVQAKAILYDLSTIDLYREKAAASATLIAGLTTQKEALLLEVGNLKGIVTRTKDLASASESSARLIGIFAATGTLILGFVLGVLVVKL